MMMRHVVRGVVGGSVGRGVMGLGIAMVLAFGGVSPGALGVEAGLAGGDEAGLGELAEMRIGLAERLVEGLLAWGLAGEAEAEIGRGQAAAEQVRGAVEAGRYDEWQMRLDELRSEVAKVREAGGRIAAADERENAADVDELDGGRRRRDRDIRREKTVRWLREAAAAREQGDGQSARKTLRRLLYIDKDNEAAGLMLASLEGAGEWRGALARLERAERREKMVGSDERAGAGREAEPTEDRDRTVESVASYRERDEAKAMGAGAVREEMEGRRMNLDLEDVEFAEAIDELKRMWGFANIFPVWGDLEAVGIYADDMVTVRLEQVSFRTALESVLRAASGGKVEAADYWVTDAGVIEILPASKAYANKLEVRTYYVGDLVQKPVEADSGGSGRDRSRGGSDRRSGSSSGSKRRSSSSSSSGSKRSVSVSTR